MTPDYVVADDPLEDDDRAPARPIGAQLALLGEKAVDFPADLLVSLGREAGAVYLGALLLVSRWRLWQTDAAHRARLEDASAVAKAAGGKLPLAHQELSIKRQAQRARVSLLLAGSGAAALTAGSVVSITWGGWQTAGVCAAVGMLWAAHEYKLRVLVLGSPLPVVVVLLLGVDEWRWWPAAAVVVAAALVCEQVGLRWRPPASQRSAGRPHAGMSFANLWESVRLRWLEEGVDQPPKHAAARPVIQDGAEVGVGFRVSARSKITPEVIAATARELHLGKDRIRWTPDPSDESAGELLVLFADPLPPRPMPRREPMSLSYVRPFDVARRDGNRATALSVNRTRILLAGNSGSGKSQAEQGILDAVCDMADASWSAIDRQEGPTFKAYRHQWNCTGVHFGREEALAEVRRLRAVCIDRNRRLDEGMDADLDGEIDQWWIVSGEPDRRGHVLFIDELSSATTDREFAGELTLLLEVCRKASVSVVMATPDLDKDRVPRAVLDQVNTTIGFACPFSDAVQMFGKGSTQSGWEPFALVPAADDEPNDAGKAFIRGGPYNRPEVHRFGEMSKDEIVARNRTRRLWRERFVDPLAGEVVDEQDAEIVDAVIVTDEDLAREAAIRRALALCGDREGLPVAELSSQDRESLRGLLESRSIWHSREGRTIRSFTRESLVRASQAAAQ